MQKLILSSEIILKYLIAAILIGVTLYPKFPLLRVPSTFVSIRLEDLLIALAFIFFCIYLIVSKKLKYFIDNKLTLIIFLFITAGFLSTLSSIGLTYTATPHIAFLHWLRRIEYFTPLFMGYFLLKYDKGLLNYYFKLILIILTIVFIYGYGQRYFSWPIVITQNEEYSKGVALRWISGSHINSTFAGHYDLASFLVLILPTIVCYLFLTKIKLEKFLLMICFSFGMWLLVNSASRISLVSYIGAVSISLFLIKKYKAIPLVLIVSLAFTMFSSNLLGRYGRIIEVVKNKLSLVRIESVYAAEITSKSIVTSSPTPVPVFEDRSTNIRLNVEWPRAIRAFLKNPLLGTGYSSITLATDNDYIRALGESGLLGFIGFSLIFLQIGINFINKVDFSKFNLLEKAFVAGIIGSTFGVFLNAVFIDIFEASKFAINYWLLIGFSQGLIDNYE